MIKIPLAEEFGKALVPKRFRPDLKNYLYKAGIYKSPYEYFGMLFYLSLLITFLLYVIFFVEFLRKLPTVLTIIGSFLSWTVVPVLVVLLFIVIVYFYLDIKIYTRTQKLEEILPDFLSSVSSNLKGGMSFENALWTSIKPRFGVLSSEISIAAKKVMTGHDIDQALQEFAMKYDSSMLRRSIDLISSEITSGGKVSDILDSIVHNLKKTKELKDEMNASVLAYMIFISAIVIFIAPILFALSFNLLLVLKSVTGLLAQTSTSAAAPGLLGGVGEVAINEQHFITFSKTAIILIALFSSMIVSILEKGSIKSGIKYIPIFLISSYVFYLFALKIFTLIFGAFIQVG